MKNLLILFFSGIVQFSIGQSIGIGTQNPDSSAALDISSADQGILIPRTDTVNITNPAIGLLIYQLSDNSFYYYDGSWNRIGQGGPSDKILDADNDTKVVVEETTDNDEIRFYSDGVEVMSHDGQALQMKNNGQSVMIGEYAGANDDFTDNKNVFIGYKAGESNTTGVHNNIIGNQALNLNTTGSNNVSIGQQSLFKSNGSNNIAMGLNASKESTTGSKNVSIGNFANFINQQGNDNVVIGDEAGRGSTMHSKSGNVFIGSRSGKNVATDGNIAIGRDALLNNENGYNNIAIGDSAMYEGNPSGFLDFGSDNVAFGHNAAKKNSNGRKNTFVGNNSATQNTSGSFNTSLGYGSLSSSSSSFHNTVVGFQSGEKITTGLNNVMVGSNSGLHTTTGTDNVLLGKNAGLVNTEGSNNIMIGLEAGQENRSGSNNVYLGNNAGKNVISGSGNVFIGNDAGKDHTGNDHQLIIANSADNTPLIEGRFDSLTTQINGQLIINDQDSTGYALPKEDGNFGSLLRTDGNGEAYWSNISTISAVSPPGSGGSITDDSSDDADNFLAIPCQDYTYYIDIEDIPGESSNSNTMNQIVGYGIDLSYINTGLSDCSNMRISFRKQLDKATPKIIQRSFQGYIFDEVVISQYDMSDLKVEFVLSDVVIQNVRHETYNREGEDKYSSYEVVNLSFSTIEMIYYEYNDLNDIEEVTFVEVNCNYPYLQGQGNEGSK